MVLVLAGCGPRFTTPTANPAGLEAARRLIASTPVAGGVAATPDAAERVLAAILQRLVPAAQPLCTAHLGHDCAFQVSLDPSGTARAAIAGRGRVIITLGMMRLLGSEEEVAAVLGHEFGHHLAGHIERRYARGLAGGTAASTLLGALVPFGGLAGWLLGQGAAQLGAEAAQLVFSKEEEREADYLGAYLVARAGYDLDRAGLVWVRLTRGGPQETTGLLDSHPAGPERLAAWRETVEEIRRTPDLMPHRSGRQAPS
jgi:Zn-dependent protease with chaperone function